MGISKGQEAREEPGVLEELEPGRMTKIQLEEWIQVGPTMQVAGPDTVPALSVPLKW